MSARTVRAVSMLRRMGSIIAILMPPQMPVQFPLNNVVHLTRDGGDLQSENGPITAPQFIHEYTFVNQKVTSDAGIAVSSVYMHIPFCFHKCHYCDFYSIVDSRDRQGVFIDRLIAELQAACCLVDLRNVKTIFVGGGTPTLLAAEQWQRLLDAIADYLAPAADCEFTVEANPETVTAQLAATLVRGGVNRISIGAQSFNQVHLKTLERWHDPANVKRSVELIRNAGIESINLDLIFAIPGQSLDDWLTDLDTALVLEPSHLSCYGLTYEPNTPMTAKMRQGRFEPADQEVEAAMYRAILQRLAEAGFEHYEISAWARPGKRCQHNLRYWTNADWWPLGPSASGHVAGVRWKNIPRLGSYLESSALPPIVDFEQVDVDTRVGEALMLGLRLVEGMSISDVHELLAVGQRGKSRADAIAHHTAAGLLEQIDGRLRLTCDGLLLADSVLADLV